jgi:hypothetical protein
MCFLEIVVRQPWDRPEFAIKGDSDSNYTYMAVGRVLSQWEGTEIQLGYIYSAASGKPGDWYALLEYGEGSTSTHRLRIVRDAVDEFFIKNPNQAAEGRAVGLLKAATNFAGRRHDIAHGIVRDHTWARWRIPPDTTDTTGYFLLPSHYKGSAYSELALPLYAYTSASMEALRHQLILLETEAMGVAELLRRLESG